MEQQENKEQKLPENPLDFIYHPDLDGIKVEMSLREYVILTQFYKQFEYPVALSNNFKDKFISEGILRPVYPSDTAIENGKRVVRADFWEVKKEPVEQPTVKAQTLQDVKEEAEKPKMQVVKD